MIDNIKIDQYYLKYLNKHIKLIESDRGTRPYDVRQPPDWEGANSCRMIIILEDKSKLTICISMPLSV